ncbi:hypothetical protein GW17_00004806 [Ensete ventricosum]|nr:hypothetical protein GW17_00004806 [Ensete ventricosum]RZS28608.1 hypothetical protein BHM03_00062234 [Ensete ventricosum]
MRPTNRSRHCWSLGQSEWSINLGFSALFLFHVASARIPRREQEMSGKRGSSNQHEDMELRRGPWTLEEDTLLVHYIAFHGEGRWNLLARCSGDRSSSHLPFLIYLRLTFCCSYRLEENRQELSFEVVELLEARYKARQSLSRGEVPDPRAPVQVGEQVIIEALSLG